MRCRAVLLGSAISWVLLGCRPSADHSRPHDQALETETETETETEPAPLAERDDAHDSPAAPADDPPEPSEPTSAAPKPPSGAEPAEAEPSEAEPSEAAPKPKPRAKLAALPKPHYTKVDASCGNDGNVGQKLKGFELATTGGKKVTHGSYRGRVVVVNFWGTWCKPCLKELPEFDHLYRRYRKHGMTLVAIATDEDPVPVDEFVNKRKLAAKVLIGGEAYANEYGSPKFPFTFVVDHTGVIRGSYRGYRPECMGKLEADIREQLEKRNE
jgi:peroxiredoxin